MKGSNHSKALTEKQKLRNMAAKIKKIPKTFSDSSGKLDLDKVHATLLSYHNKEKTKNGS